MKQEAVGSEIVDAAIRVHTALGAGLLEGAYEACLAYELGKRGLSTRQQIPMPVRYEGVVVDIGYRIDMLVEDRLCSSSKQWKSYFRSTAPNC